MDGRIELFSLDGLCIGPSRMEEELLLGLDGPLDDCWITVSGVCGERHLHNLSRAEFVFLLPF